MKKFPFTLSLLFFAFFSSAQITFQKTYGTKTYQAGLYVQQTTDNGFFVVGNSDNTGATDMYVIKTDYKGDTLWTKIFDDFGNENGFWGQQTIDGGYIISGNKANSSASSWDFYLVKTDTNGNLLWSKTYGGSSGEFSHSCQQTADGGYIIIGYTLSFGAGQLDIFLVKVNSNGSLAWSKVYGGVDNDEGNSVRQTMDGGYIITGYVSNIGAGNEDVLLIKTDSMGNILWTKSYGGSGDDKGFAVQQTSDSGYVIIGYTHSFSAGYDDFYLIKTNVNGDTLWTRTYGNQTCIERGTFVSQTLDGGYILSGTVCNNQVCIIKTDANGDTLWTKKYGGPLYDYGFCSFQTNDGGYIISGSYNSGAPHVSDVYLIKTDSLGNSGCSESVPILVVKSTPTQVTSPLLTVTFPSTIVTSPSTVTKSGGIVTTLCSTVGSNEITSDNSFLIFPNPSSGKFAISFDVKIMEGTIEMQNIIGESVFRENIFNESKKEINLKNISDGIYFVKLFDGEKMFTQKIIIN